MSKIGVSISIDVTKIDKAQLYKGAKGTYLSAVVFIDTENKDQHGNSGMMVQDWKDAPKGQTPILGNVKVFWSDAGQGGQQQQRPQQGYAKPAPMAEPDFDSDILF